MKTSITNILENAQTERNLYFYHPDHLGSTSLITNLDGEIVQNVAYIPFGEVFVEERNGSYSTSYLFNAKELDSETGLYYYGARYLDPSDAMWLSVDPLWEKYVGMTPYQYCAGNPVKFIDPIGCDTVFFEENGNEIGRIKSEQESYFVVKTTQSTDEMYKESSPTQKGNSNPISESDALRAKVAVSLACNGDGVVKKEDIPWHLLEEIPNSTAAHNAFDYIDDNMGGGTDPANNMEYSFNIHNTTFELFSNAKSESVGDPAINTTLSTPSRRHHTHPSGNNGDSKYQQPPSKSDIKNSKGYGNYTRFVWGMRSKKIYIFTEYGVTATVPFSIYGK